jgi:hypothetical protein
MEHRGASKINRNAEVLQTSKPWTSGADGLLRDQWLSPQTCKDCLLKCTLDEGTLLALLALPMRQQRLNIATAMLRRPHTTPTTTDTPAVVRVNVVLDVD